jgi:hypothetical protein
VWASKGITTQGRRKTVALSYGKRNMGARVCQRADIGTDIDSSF